MWSSFRREFPNTPKYDQAFAFYEHFYKDMLNPHIISHHIENYAQTNLYEDGRLVYPPPKTRFAEMQVSDMEQELKYLIQLPSMTNEHQERIVLLCNKILQHKVTPDMFTAVEILIRNTYGAAALEAFIPRLVKEL
jgi:hypothetical protein